MDSFSAKECPQCNAKWMGEQLYWSTGAEGCPHDLAGLVCNDYGDERCINPCKGSTSGQTWEFRRGMIAGLMQEHDRKSEQD
ncbi:hypothetical protein [Synechococcus phage metaG-MbCM1]|jgi:hypothetical protein|uniref:Uncharacterized protein n=1 Tax=Synechococcus phage metaG-MbCM1 TaxID=1079999 RepID=H8ZN94_9CAUD|nr:hypothetical protein [Synechococcus phage metaG-MbCM1]AFD02955.1 hypothetical protein [Synechococcus phage metaG-MbCM1]|tara:strand:- start:170 stop:415 length:246 start_codon:yes stop_codon:yes gene_type:complete